MEMPTATVCSVYVLSLVFSIKDKRTEKNCVYNDGTLNNEDDFIPVCLHNGHVDK